MGGTRSGWRRWFSAFRPSASEPEMAAARVIDQAALAPPAVALDLLAREQLAVAHRLPQYLDDIRHDTWAQVTASAGVQHQHTLAALKEITRASVDLAARAESAPLMQRVSALAERNELLATLGDSIRELADTVRGAMTSAALAPLSADMAEALHVVLLSAIDALESPDQSNLQVLDHLTADRSQVMESIRRTLLRGEHTLTIAEHQALFTSTRLFERIILLLRQLQIGLAPH